MTGRNLGRLYFGAQALAGAGWWLAVFTIPAVRDLTLGDLPPVPVAIVDVPLFVAASALAAAGIRWAVWVVVSWTLFVTTALAVYSTLTGDAGWGAVLMVAASIGGIGAGMLVLLGRVPTERVLIGPLAFRTADSLPRSGHVARTAVQLIVFWSLFLAVFPAIIATLETRWGVHLPFPPVIPLVGVGVLAVASTLGVWSAVVMARRGDGTPLPSDATTRLVVDGPYRFVRNPMAIAGIAQGAAVGLMVQSWLVVAYAVAGSLAWNWFVRPLEERDLAAKFGQAYRDYAARVRCWVPRIRARRVET